MHSKTRVEGMQMFFWPRSTVRVLFTSGRSDCFEGQIVYSTYLGGSDFDVLIRLAVDSNYNLWIAGQTSSINFPVVNAFQNARASDAGTVDCFVAKFDSLGNFLFFF